MTVKRTSKGKTGAVHPNLPEKHLTADKVVVPRTVLCQMEYQITRATKRVEKAQSHLDELKTQYDRMEALPSNRKGRSLVASA